MGCEPLKWYVILRVMYPYFITSTKPPVFPDNLVPDDTGLVALGGNLAVSTLIEAYSKGIFPWSGEDPIPWYSPDPRLVLFPQDLHVSKRMRRIIRSNKFQVKFDNDFTGIMTKCAITNRKDQEGTWINSRLINAYTKLFHFCIAHCVGVYVENKICGGLYGLSLGKCFFGESMFSEIPNSSKIALYFLAQFCLKNDILFIDCQQVTPHMLRLGAIPLTRNFFLTLLKDCKAHQVNTLRWQYP
ncbi:MAG: leucyl/phenylalanyl-tRNA--protein transferase [Spirochaetales bacterium]|nr:leucyl/phenylalanyl-tRNA--protein transferase [Spirochaetales bacterium]